MLLRRVIWGIVWLLLFRPSPRVLHAWRRMLLRLFGAKIGRGALVYPSCTIWAPWNLEMRDFSQLGPNVDCYCVDKIVLEDYAIVSQYCYLCSASHDYQRLDLPTISAPIRIGQRAWVCADVFIAPGVCVGEGAVVGARSSVFKNVEPWSVVTGNPAKFIKKRVILTDAPVVAAPAAGGDQDPRK
jgi:putative colanic acid biosynthesis acetyltransferase WcaF